MSFAMPRAESAITPDLGLLNPSQSINMSSSSFICLCNYVKMQNSVTIRLHLRINIHNKGLVKPLNLVSERLFPTTAKSALSSSVQLHLADVSYAFVKFVTSSRLNVRLRSPTGASYKANTIH